MLNYTVLYNTILDARPSLRSAGELAPAWDASHPATKGGGQASIIIRPVHLLRVSLLKVLESNFPGDPL